jgi:hypothetical protein
MPAGRFIHAIWRRSQRFTRRAYARLFKEHPHLAAGTASSMPRYGRKRCELSRLGIGDCAADVYTRKRLAARRLGNERCKTVLPFRSFLDAGIKVSGASDALDESQDVLHAIQCCVSREGSSRSSRYRWKRQCACTWTPPMRSLRMESRQHHSRQARRPGGEAMTRLRHKAIK